MYHEDQSKTDPIHNNTTSDRNQKSDVFTKTQLYLSQSKTTKRRGQELAWDKFKYSQKRGFGTIYQLIYCGFRFTMSGPPFPVTVLVLQKQVASLSLSANFEINT